MKYIWACYLKGLVKKVVPLRKKGVMKNEGSVELNLLWQKRRCYHTCLYRNQSSGTKCWALTKCDALEWILATQIKNVEFLVRKDT